MRQSSGWSATASPADASALNLDRSPVIRVAHHRSGGPTRRPAPSGSSEPPTARRPTWSALCQPQPHAELAAAYIADGISVVSLSGEHHRRSRLARSRRPGPSSVAPTGRRGSDEPRAVRSARRPPRRASCTSPRRSTSPPTARRAGLRAPPPRRARRNRSRLARRRMDRASRGQRSRAELVPRTDRGARTATAAALADPLLLHRCFPTRVADQCPGLGHPTRPADRPAADVDTTSPAGDVGAVRVEVRGAGRRWPGHCDRRGVRADRRPGGGRRGGVHRSLPRRLARPPASTCSAEARWMPLELLRRVVDLGVRLAGVHRRCPTVGWYDRAIPCRPMNIGARREPVTPWLPEGSTLVVPGRGELFYRRSPTPRSRGADGDAAARLDGKRRSAVLHGLRGTGRQVLVHHHRPSWPRSRPAQRAAFQLEDVADDAAALLDALGVGPVVAVGYSMGGPVSHVVGPPPPHLVRGARRAGDGVGVVLVTVRAGALEDGADHRPVAAFVRLPRWLSHRHPPAARRAATRIWLYVPWLSGEMRRNDPLSHRAGRAGVEPLTTPAHGPASSASRRRR